MQQRPFQTGVLLVLCGFASTTAAQAEISCPTSYRLEVAASPAANTTVGPGPENKHRSNVTAQLTSSKAICSVRPPKELRFTVVHTAVQLPGNESTKYFSHPWEESRGLISKLIEGKPKKASPTQVTTASVLTHGAYPGAPVNGLEVVFDCATQPAVQVRTSSGTWQATSASAIPVDVTLAEAPSLRGSPRLFDVTCHYEYPAPVSVDFPRQTRSDNRDISTNLNKTGFYRVYDMNAELWKKVCARDCSDNLTVVSGRTEGLGEHIQQCTKSCIQRGW